MVVVTLCATVPDQAKSQSFNCNQDDDDEAAPLTMTEEDHSAAQLTALDDGSAVLEDAPDAEGSTALAGPCNAEPVD